MSFLDADVIETVIIVSDIEGDSEYPYTSEKYHELVSEYGKDNVRLQDRMSWM